MRSGCLARSGWRLAGSVLAALCLVLTAQPPAAAAESAVWVETKINFTYQGFTTHYSCQGLEDAVRSVLVQLGARKSDMNLRQTGCTSGFDRPEPYPGVVGTIEVLEPVENASRSEASAASPNGSARGEHGKRTVEAEWRTVTVRIGPEGADQSGKCELLNQVKRRILPLFAAREVKFESDCFPHQLTIGKTMLQVQVLKPVGPENRDVASAAE